MSLEILAGGAVLCAVMATLRGSRLRADAAQRLQAATLSSIGDAVIATDLAGRITFMNPEAERLTACSNAEAIGCALETVFRVANQETGLAVENPVASVLRSGQAQGLANHTVLTARDGSTVPIETKASPIRNVDGALEGVVLIFRDCTQRHQVEDALRERLDLREQLAQIADTVPGVICAYRVRPDGSSCYPFASQRIEELYGLSAEQLARDAGPAFGVIHPDDAAGVVASSAESARRLEQWHGEFRVNHPTKGLIWVEGRSMPEMEADGSVLWRGFLSDVTDRKNAEEALRQSEERFRQIAETIREVFWLTDPDTHQILYASPAFEAIWGRPCETLQMSSSAWLEAIHPDDRDRVAQASANERSGNYNEEYRIVRPDGSVRWIHDRGFPVRDKSGNVIRIAGVAEDITARHDLEAELRQAQKMESVGLLAGGVAHDFNNALTVILGATEGLAEGTPASPEAAAMLDEIRSATERAASLTRQLLAFSRKEVVAPRVIDFNALVSDTERMLRRLLGEDIELVAALDPDIAHVKVDAGQWDQVLVNLAVNARDAMTGCGRLTIETHDARVDANAAESLLHGVRPGRYVKISMADTGSGMPPDVLSRIFEPFFTTKGVGRGTGLGLAVVYGIVKQSGGHIDVRSEVGAGTTFTILVPTVDAAIADGTVCRTASPPLRATSGETILLVEDEDGLRRMAARTLGKQGYSVLQASSGPEALRVIEAHEAPVDLLVTDVVMPIMDGRELAERVQHLRPSIRVLFTSGYTEDAILHRGVEAAHVAFLQKPYAPAALAGKVREVLQLNMQMAP